MRKGASQKGCRLWRGFMLDKDRVGVLVGTSMGRKRSMGKVI